jgi:hypothetical protein
MMAQRGLRNPHIELAPLMDSPIEQARDHGQPDRTAESMQDLMEFDLVERWVMYRAHKSILAKDR